MDFISFLRDILGITTDFDITHIDKNDEQKTIKIHLK